MVVGYVYTMSMSMYMIQSNLNVFISSYRWAMIIIEIPPSF